MQGGDAPKILVPYPGPQSDGSTQDVFIYLRPETNGVAFESQVLGVVSHNPSYKRDFKLIYLANIPGSYIVNQHIIEQHYAIRLFFAVHGKDAFTDYMMEEFERFCGCTLHGAPLIGSFAALKKLDMDPDELFNTWVEKQDVLMVNGQIIKRIGDYYVVNYDIPALLKKNTRETDIAVMMFRTSATYATFRGLVHEMRARLVERELINPEVHVSRYLHYSKGPFEQVLDGTGYLLRPDREHVKLEDLSFVQYLDKKGYPLSYVSGLLNRPIIRVRRPDGNLQECNLMEYTSGLSYEAALNAVRQIESQVLLPRHFSMDDSTSRFKRI